MAEPTSVAKRQGPTNIANNIVDAGYVLVAPRLMRSLDRDAAYLVGSMVGFAMLGSASSCLATDARLKVSTESTSLVRFANIANNEVRMAKPSYANKHSERTALPKQGRSTRT